MYAPILYLFRNKLNVKYINNLEIICFVNTKINFNFK